MSKNLSQIVAELFAKPAEGEELSSQIQRLGVELRKVFQSEGAIFGKFRGLLESFREIIPDEQQRHQAALKALSTTEKLSRQELIKAINGQLEELKIVEKSVMPSLPGRRDELKAMEARTQERKGEIAKLRERLAQLENEEKTALAAIAEREKDLEAVEKTIKDIFAEISAEMTSLRKKVEELPAESTDAQPVPQKEPVQSVAPGEKKESGGQKSEAEAPPAGVDPKFQKKCPMCGGQFNLLEVQGIWQCYNCAYEEPATGGAQRTSEEKSGPVNAPKPAPAPEPAAGPSPSIIEPLATMADEYQGSIKRSSPAANRPRINTKTCPVCRMQMFWYKDEKAWRCPSCKYERMI